MMIFINAVYKEEIFPREYKEGFVKLLNPVCPHITEELWLMLGHNETIANETWPTYDESKIAEDDITIGVQVNGKVRGTITIAKDEEEDSVKDKALNDENVKKYIQDKEIVKLIIIPNKIVSIVVK